MAIRARLGKNIDQLGESSGSSVTGSGISGQVAYWSGASTLAGSTGLAFNSTSLFLGIGATPTTKLTISGNVSASAWTTGGIGIKSIAATYTDTSSSGTVASMYVHTLGVPTISASSSTTFTDAGGLYVEAPIVGSLVTITNPYAIITNGNIRVLGTTGIVSFAQNGVNRVGSGSTYNVQQGGSSRYTIATNGNHTFTNAAASSGTTAFTTFTQIANTGGSAGGLLFTSGAHTGQTSGTEINDILLNIGRTVTWTTTVPTTQRFMRITQPTISCASVSTTTTAATFSIQGQPLAAGSAAITNAYSFWVEAGNSLFAGSIAIGNTVNAVSPTSPNRTVTMVIGGTTYYLHAKTTND